VQCRTGIRIRKSRRHPDRSKCTVHFILHCCRLLYLEVKLEDIPSHMYVLPSILADFKICLVTTVSYHYKYTPTPTLVLAMKLLTLVRLGSCSYWLPSSANNLACIVQLSHIPLPQSATLGLHSIAHKLILISHPTVGRRLS